MHAYLYVGLRNLEGAVHSLEGQVEKQRLGRVVVPHYPLSSGSKQVGGVGSPGGPVYGFVVPEIVSIFLACLGAEKY